jgi:hypothetical protein
MNNLSCRNLYLEIVGNEIASEAQIHCCLRVDPRNRVVSDTEVHDRTEASYRVGHEGNDIQETGVV